MTGQATKVRRACIVPGCPATFPALPGRSRCDEHEREHERTKPPSPSSQAIRHDRDYHRTRQRWLNRLNAGHVVVCSLCGHRIDTADELSLDHVVSVADGGTSTDGLAPAHRRCNYRKGAATARRSRPSKPSPLDANRRARRPPWTTDAGHPAHDHPRMVTSTTPGGG